MSSSFPDADQGGDGVASGDDDLEHNIIDTGIDSEDDILTEEEQVVLDADDTMYHPSAVNRIDGLSEPLITRGASCRSKDTDAPNSSDVPSKKMSVTRNTRNTRNKAAVTTKSKKSTARGRKRTKTEQPVSDSPTVQEALPNSNDVVITESSATPLPSDTAMPPRRLTIAEKTQELADNGGYGHNVQTSKPRDKGKRKRDPSPEPPPDETAGEGDCDSVLEEDPGDAEEAKQLREAIQLSISDKATASARERVGESSGSNVDESARHQVSRTPDVHVPSTPHRPSRQLSQVGVSPASPSSEASSVHSVAASPPSSSPTSGASASPSPRRTFAAARSQALGGSMRPMVSARSLHNANEYRVRALPATCQVNNPVLQDELLAPQYAGLPNLTLGVFIPWSNIRGSGQFRFSHWGDVCPDMDYENAFFFITFTVSGNYINPSRASPTLTRAVRVSANGFRMNLHLGGQPAILVSTIYVRQSNIITPPSRGLRQRGIGGVGHTQEWERQVSFICMAFGQPELHAQLSGDVITFTTRSDTSAAYNSAQGGFSSSQSPSIRLAGAGTTPYRSDDMSLDFGDPIPVYDARSTPVDVNNIQGLNSLPLLRGEVPLSSFAAVGYTANAYLSNRDNRWHVSLNIRFVVVVGTPSDEVVDEAVAED